MEVFSFSDHGKYVLQSLDRIQKTRIDKHHKA